MTHVVFSFGLVCLRATSLGFVMILTAAAALWDIYSTYTTVKNAGRVSSDVLSKASAVLCSKQHLYISGKLTLKSCSHMSHEHV